MLSLVELRSWKQSDEILPEPLFRTFRIKYPQIMGSYHGKLIVAYH